VATNNISSDPYLLLSFIRFSSDKSKSKCQHWTNAGITIDYDSNPRPFGAGYDMGHMNLGVLREPSSALELHIDVSGNSVLR